MLVGHCAAALLAKRAEPRVSLGTAMLAALLPDLLSVVLQIAGIEHVRANPGLKGIYAVDLYDIPWSHSLLTNAVWGAMLAAAYYLGRRYTRGAWLLFALVLSHWMLDFASHRPDMPLAPGLPFHAGLGLWTSIPATLIVEGGLWLAAIAIYVRAFRAGLAFWLAIPILTLAWINNIRAGPPPPGIASSITGLIFFSLVVAWAYGVDKKTHHS